MKMGSLQVRWPTHFAMYAKSSLIAIIALSATLALAGVNEDLIKAAQRGDLAEVKRLISEGADVNAKNEKGSPALMYACEKGHTAVVKELLAKGADVNFVHKNGFTPIFLATVMNYPAVVKELLAKGANVNVRTAGVSPLGYAAQWGHVEIRDMLVKAGARQD